MGVGRSSSSSGLAIGGLIVMTSNVAEGFVTVERSPQSPGGWERSVAARLEGEKARASAEPARRLRASSISPPGLRRLQLSKQRLRPINLVERLSRMMAG